MVYPKIIDEMAKRLSDAVPSGVRDVQTDLQEKFRSLLQASFSQCELVTREEFDIQVKVLARTREKVDAMEQQVAELERKILTAEKSAKK